jgi:hypothetical protein
MQLLWPLLTGITLLAPPSVPSEDAPSTPRVVLQRFLQLDPAAQQQWIRGLLTRLDRANQVVLEPDQGLELWARYPALLHRMAQGETISRDELQGLLRQTDQREKAAIEQLARKFRVQVYHTFRPRRGVFTRRRAAWNRVHAFWEVAGGRFEQQDRLIDWLESAIRSSTPQTVGPLPADLKFEFQANPSQAIVRHLPTEAIKEPEIKEPEIKELTIQEPTIQEVIAPSVEELPIPPPKPAVALPERNRRVAQRTEVSRPNSETIDLPPSENQSLIVVPPPELTDHRPTSRPTASDTPAPSAARLPAGLPLAVEPTLATTGQSTQPASTVEVNLDELTAQIAGANLALRALEAKLDEQRQWNARRLGPLVDQLGRLVIRNNDLATFRKLISTQQRAPVGQLESPRAAITRLAALIHQARNHASGPDSGGTKADRQAELYHLDELSRALAELAFQQ